MLPGCVPVAISSREGGRNGRGFYRSRRGGCDLVALHLGLKFAGDPQWFYGLTKREQIAVLAYNRIENKPKKSNRGQLPPGLKVESEEARRFWMGE